MNANKYAFPFDGHLKDDTRDHHLTAHGITIRDYFAIRALAPMIQLTADNKLNKKWGELAEIAYAIADAMMEERKK